MFPPRPGAYAKACRLKMGFHKEYNADRLPTLRYRHPLGMAQPLD
jgi:hypothetical protein